MDDLDANPVSGSDSDPVSMIEGLLERETAPTTQAGDQKPEPEKPEQPEEPETEEAPAEEGGEDEDGEQPETEEQQAAPVTEKFVVKVDGEELEVTKEELLQGYQRQADYSRKTAEVAEQRRAAEALAQSVHAERQHYTQQLDQVATLLQATLPPAPTEQQLQDDPIGYVQAERQYNARVAQLQQVLAERDRVGQQTAAERQAQHQQFLASAREQLLEKLPEWRDPEKARAGQREVAEYLRTTGYSVQEIAAAADPRAIVMARKAMAYDKLQAAKPAVQQRLATAPKMVKPGAAGPAPDQRKAVINQLRRSNGKDIDAAARLIELG